VTLVSSPLWTALGVRQPTILRTLLPGASIVIGDDTGISGAVICAARSVKIGKRVLIGANVIIVDTDFHPLAPQGRYRAPIPAPSETDEVTIGDDVFIGTGALILKGVRIGDGAVVGAGSIVTRDVPPRQIVAGNPARVIGEV
jgi:acetyltransferase-like isoleucine patch superfamily enzyme